jgi:hypothetical protein
MFFDEYLCMLTKSCNRSVGYHLLDDYIEEVMSRLEFYEDVEAVEDRNTSKLIYFITYSLRSKMLIIVNLSTSQLIRAVTNLQSVSRCFVFCDDEVKFRFNNKIAEIERNKVSHLHRVKFVDDAELKQCIESNLNSIGAICGKLSEPEFDVNSTDLTKYRFNEYWFYV